MQKIVNCLWFDDQAQEAANFYVSVFSAMGQDSKIGDIANYGKAGSKVSGKPEGSVLTVAFKLGNQEFVALNGGPVFKFTPANSLMVYCKDQEEIDGFWEKLTQGGQEGQCGWLTDKYGLSWQITPDILDKMILDKNPEKRERVMEIFLTMKKINIDGLKRAYEKE